MSSSSSESSPATISVRRSSPLAVDLLDLEQLLADQRVDAGRIAEDRAELGDALLEIGVLVLDLLARESGQRARGAGRGSPAPGSRRSRSCAISPVRAVVGVVGATDQRDHRVEVVERDQVAREDVGALLGLAQLELRAARDDLALEVEVVPDELEQRQHAGHAVDERDGVVAEGRLQRGVLEELVERDLRDRVALQLDLDPHAGAVGVVGEIGDLGDHLLVDEIGDLLDHAAVAALLDAVGQLGDDDRALAAAKLLDVRARPHDDPAAAGAVGVADPGAADDDGAGREVGPMQVLHQVLDIRVGLVDQLHDCVDRSRRGGAAACSSPCRPRFRRSR